MIDDSKIYMFVEGLKQTNKRICIKLHLQLIVGVLPNGE